LFKFLQELGGVVFLVEFVGIVGNGESLENLFGFLAERAVGFRNYGHDARF
jgi:hypothetical protein